MQKNHTVNSWLIGTAPVHRSDEHGNVAVRRHCFFIFVTSQSTAGGAMRLVFCATFLGVCRIGFFVFFGNVGDSLCEAREL